jgi:hypothetical protein
MTIMKIRTLLLAGLATSALAAPALADPAPGAVTGTVDIFGHVNDRCNMTINSAFIDLGEITNADDTLNTGVAAGKTATLHAWCNGSAADMRVEAFPITNQSFTGSPPAGFQRIVNYTATASTTGSAGPVAPTDVSDSAGASGPGTPATVGIVNNDIIVSLSGLTTPAAGRMVAGSYHGLVVVTLTPNVSVGQGN